MIHYIYKIHFLCGFPCGRYYIGKRTFRGNDLKKDKYTGSGNFCKSYFKKYGALEGQTYIKEILEINPNKSINTDREAYWVGTSYKDDKLCMNLIPGGIAPKLMDGNLKEHSIKQYSINGEFIKEWPSVTEAEIVLNINNINAVCNKRRHIAGGYLWRYTKEEIDHLSYKDSLCAHARGVKQYSLSGKFIKEYYKIQDAVLETGINKKSIQECCAGRQKTGGKYIWKYSNPNYKRITTINLIKSGAKKVQQYNLDGDLLNEWDSINKAAKALNKSRETIATWCRNQKLINNTILKYA